MEEEHEQRDGSPDGLGENVTLTQCIVRFLLTTMGGLIFFIFSFAALALRLVW